MPIDNVRSATLGEFNVGLVAALGFLNPLALQIDALLAIGLGPFQLDVTARLNALLGFQANLSLTVGFNLVARLQLLLAAIAQIQAALAAALDAGFTIGVNAEISAYAAITGTLSIQLGLLDLAIQAALAIKIPALRFIARLSANLSLGPAFAIATSGELGIVGDELQTLFNQVGGLQADGNQIQPWENTYGIYLLTKEPSVTLALQAIIQV